MRNLILLFVLCAAAPLIAQSAAGMKWTAPAGWKAEAERPMRAATYTVAAAAGDRDPAECGIFFFGQGQGGGVEANIERWRSQFTDLNGKVTPAKIDKHTSGDLKFTRIDTSGYYSGMGGPMAGGSKPVAGYRLLGAIVEGPGGNVFIKFTGPMKTIAANQQKFQQLLDSFRPERGR